MNNNNELPQAVQDELTAGQKQAIAEKMVQETIEKNKEKDIGSLVGEIRNDAEALMVDEATVKLAAKNIEQKIGDSGHAIVTDLDEGVLGNNQVGTKNTNISTDVVKDAAIGNDTQDLTMVLEHEGAHERQTNDVQTVIGKNGEQLTRFDQLEGHAETQSDAANKRKKPEDYAQARKVYESNNTKALDSYVTGNADFEATQTELLKSSSQTEEQQAKSLEAVGVQQEVTARILAQVHGTRSAYQNGPVLSTAA